MKIKVEESPLFKVQHLVLGGFMFLLLVWAGRDPESFANFWGPVLANLVKAVYRTIRVFLSTIAES